jgi:exodeoxyribonuclease VII large subunit
MHRDAESAGGGARDESSLFGRVAPGSTGGEETGPRVYTVAELTRDIKHALDRIGRVSVEGEITRIVHAASGHLYFDLKDIDAKIACTIWRSQVASALRFDVAEGMQVVAHGKLDVYGPRGTYSLNVQRLEQRGIGALLAQLEELKAELKKRGWFDRKRPLPAMPRVIGVVTSRDGAAFQDFLRTRSLRWPLYPVRLAHTSVQGAGAAREIADAIRRLDASRVDVIVLIRGGGSLEDLWAFNELAVAEAIFAASVPVVSGVGHETDVTLADLVADHRAHTPTDAAQTILPDRASLLADLESSANHLMQAMDEILADYEERIERAARSPVLRDGSWMLGERARSLDHAERALRLALTVIAGRADSRLERAAQRLQCHHPGLVLERWESALARLEPELVHACESGLDSIEQRLRIAERTLEATSPFRVLARGYSITRRAGDRAPLVSAAGLARGDVVETRFAAGSITSTVSEARMERGARADRGENWGENGGDSAKDAAGAR